MSARLSCWLRGHDWSHVSGTWEDLFGNLWKFQQCHQCHARRRVLHEAAR